MSSFLVSASCIGAADADARVVHQHVEPAEALAVGCHEALDVVLVGHVRRHGVHVEALVAQPLGRLLELVGAAGRERDPVAVLPEHAGDGQPDAAGSAGDECGASVQELLPIVPKTAGGYLKLG